MRCLCPVAAICARMVSGPTAHTAQKRSTKIIPSTKGKKTFCKNTSSSNTNTKVLWTGGQMHSFSCAVSNNPQDFPEFRDECCHHHTKAVCTNEIHPHTGKSAKSSSFPLCSFLHNTQWGLFCSQFQQSKAGLSPQR